MGSKKDNFLSKGGPGHWKTITMGCVLAYYALVDSVDSGSQKRLFRPV